MHGSWKPNTRARTGEGADRVHDRFAAYYRALLLASQGEFYRRPDSVIAMAAEHTQLLAAWHWYTTRADLEAIRTLTPGFFWIAEAQGWARAFRSPLEACTRMLQREESRRGVAIQTVAARLPWYEPPYCQ